jgi:hypothetical protein
MTMSSLFLTQGRLNDPKSHSNIISHYIYIYIYIYEGHYPNIQIVLKYNLFIFYRPRI